MKYPQAQKRFLVLILDALATWGKVSSCALLHKEETRVLLSEHT